MTRPIRQRQPRLLYMATPKQAFGLSAVLLLCSGALLYVSLAYLHLLALAITAGVFCAPFTGAVLVYGTIYDVQATAARTDTAPTERISRDPVIPA